MARKILILGASYGSLLGTKLLMAGQEVTLVCRAETADLINREGTEIRLKLRGEETHRAFRSKELPGRLDAAAPDQVNVDDYDMVALAMSEPQYDTEDIRDLMSRIAVAQIPCISIMNMPPLPYLERIEGLDATRLRDAYNCPDVWDGFRPGLVTLCSPDPQAYRLPDEPANIIVVGLPTNFKVAAFEEPEHTRMLSELADGIDAIRVDGHEVPVKLRVHASLFVPFAKWSMLLTGNYRCILPSGTQSIFDAVHGDEARSREIYECVAALIQRLGADASDLVPFDKYAAAARGLLKPSSAARAIEGGATRIERVDRLVALVAAQTGGADPLLESIVATVDGRIARNRRAAA